MSYVSDYSKKNKTLSGEEYLKLKNLPAEERLLAVIEAPYVLSMLWTNWKNDSNIDSIVKHAIAGDANVFKQLQNKPDFVATKRADQGIRETIEYVLAHPECQKEDPDFDKWCDEIIERMK